MEIQIQTHTANDLSRLKAIAYSFLIEVNASLIVLTPAHIKGEKSIPPKVYLNCMCDIIRFLLNTNVLTSIKTITISKQLSR